MSSVNGLVHVRVVRACGVLVPPAAKLFVRVRLLPWREEGFTGSVNASEGEALWDAKGFKEKKTKDESSEAVSNEVVLAHLSTVSREAPSLTFELKSRELYVYERSLGSADMDIRGLVESEGKVEKWIDLCVSEEKEAKKLDSDEKRGKPRLLVRVEFTRGATGNNQQQVTVAEPHQHLFRLASYARPTWCAVCDRLLVGIRHQGFKCEACGLDCHRECQLKAHASFECDAENRKYDSDEDFYDDKIDSEVLSPEKKRHNSAEKHKKIQHTSARSDALRANLLPEKAEIFSANVPQTEPKEPQDDDVSCEKNNSSQPENIEPDVSEEERNAIGHLTLKLEACSLIDETKVGDHYLRVHVCLSRDAKTSTKTQRTHTVYQSSRPRFDATWHLPIETFASQIRVELVDAARDVVVGILAFGVHDLRQEQADISAETIGAKADDLQKKALGFFLLSSSAPPTTDTTQKKQPLLEKKKDTDSVTPYSLGGPVLRGLKKRQSSQTTALAFFLDKENAFFRDRHGTPTASAVVSACELHFEERELFWSAAPRAAPCEPAPENFSLEVARRHVERARQVIHSVYDVLDAYEDIMKWKDPLATLPLFVAYVACCLWLNAEYAGLLPFIWLTCLLLFTLRRRLRGDPRRRFFLKAAEALADQGDLSRKTHRPLARLRVAVCAGRSLDCLRGLSSSSTASPDVYVCASFVHGPARDTDETTTPISKHSSAEKVAPTKTTMPPATAATSCSLKKGNKQEDSHRLRRHHRRRRQQLEDDPRSEDDLLLDLLEEDEEDDDDDSDDDRRRLVVEKKAAVIKKEPTIMMDFDPQQHPMALSPTHHHQHSKKDEVMRTPPRPQPSPRHNNKHHDDEQPPKGTQQKDHKPQAAASVSKKQQQQPACVEHLLGYTGTCRGSFEPRWHGALGMSIEPRRRRVDASGVISRIVGSVTTLGADHNYHFGSSFASAESWERRGFGETGEALVDRALVYPVLQPVDDAERLRPWRCSGGHVRFRVFRQHPLDRLLDSEIGRVSVPLASLVDDAAEKRGGSQKERRGWYELTSVVNADNNATNGSQASSSHNNNAENSTTKKHDNDEVFVRSFASMSFEVDVATNEEATTSSSSSSEKKHHHHQTEERHLSSDSNKSNESVLTMPALNLRLQLVLSEASLKTSNYDLETSRAVEAMSRPLTEDDDNTSYQRLLGGGTTKNMNNPLSTVVSVHENATYAQNCLGYVLDFLESCKNALSWTHPEKTAFILFCGLVGAFLFARIPTRWLLLAGGLYEFTYRLVPFYSGSPMTTRFFNLLRSLPNDDDLKKSYEHRALSYGQAVVRDERKRRRRAKLHAIWEPLWAGTANLRDDVSAAHYQQGPAAAPSSTQAANGLRRRGGTTPGDDDDATTSKKTSTTTQKENDDAAVGAAKEAWGDRRYLVLHGRRLLWWHSERDLDVGRSPGGQLLLQGHSGLTDPSPTDLATCSKLTAHLLLAVFGQTTEGAPLRWTVMLHSSDDKANLAAAVQTAVKSRLK